MIYIWANIYLLCQGPHAAILNNPSTYTLPLTTIYLLFSLTDLNVVVGLCIGHDILFTKYSRAPVTTLIVKDRYTGHNPLAAIYSSYHKIFLK